MDRRGINALIVTGLALFMTVLDNLVVTTALPEHPRRPRRRRSSDLQWFVNALHAHVRGAAADRARRSATGSAAGACSCSASALFTAASAAAALAPTPTR